MTAAAHPLAGGLPEAWAAEWGEDRFGPFAGFAAGGVVQRMRWIPPGRFVMGSPASEAGRFEDEEQHAVEITRGFWLADTPCTQALWEAVMGENPGYFKSPDRPVEQVSWADCSDFIVRLDALVPGLGARLPSEAEWEYACRAGTSGATYAGDLVIAGENNAPQLDAIAWYGGNSGQGFELENGIDSSGWPNKQYPHKWAGTRPVRGKRPNPLGLYDMLGNVWEWCNDWSAPYSTGSTIDPTGPEMGSYRVIRGGSWLSDAGRARAAYRDARSPVYRDDLLGFRLARGQGSASGAEPLREGGERSRRP